LAQALNEAHRDNRLLAALPHDAFAEISRELRQVPLAQGKSLFEPGAPLDEIYFPQSGMILPSKLGARDTRETSGQKSLSGNVVELQPDAVGILKIHTT